MRIACFGDSLTSGRPGSSYFVFLRQHFPGDTLLNFGKSNDTVVGLHRRISVVCIDQPLDVAFLWIGVNDVPQSDSWLYRAVNSLRGQRRAKDMDEFLAYYRAILDILRNQAGRVITAPPALKGENLENRWNHHLVDIAKQIQALTTDYERVEFLDLRTVFVRELSEKSISDYLLPNTARLLADVLTLKTDAQVDAKAAERGLHVTLDGVHLNSTGARLVSQELAAAIREPALPLPD